MGSALMHAQASTSHSSFEVENHVHDIATSTRHITTSASQAQHLMLN